jgi:ADP-ribose pyrophosphatase YjhB (NUDIX family)
VPDAFERGPDGRSTDVPSGRGVPSWMADSLRFCSRCGSALVFGIIPGEDRERLACSSCGHIVYVNPRLVVTTFPITDAGEIVLIRRGIEPGKGAWAQPGGFLEVDETVHEAAIRETWEETGLLVQPGEIIGLYSRLEASVVTIAFEARIVGGTAAPTPEASEVVAFAPEEIPWSGIAFRTTTIALHDLFERRHPELEVPSISPGR